MQNEPSNQREFTRVPVNCHVILQAGGKSIPCSSVRTLSMNGLFVVTPTELPEDSEVEITITLVEHEIVIELVAAVVRNYPDGIAFRTVRILGPESYAHLRNLVLYNATDTDRVESEFDSHAGIRRRDLEED